MAPFERLLLIFPSSPYVPVLIVVTPFAVPLIASWILYRRARRETCAWSRRWRIVAQIPAWCLVPIGIIGIVGLALQGNPLGIGTVAAVITAVLNALVRGPAADA